MSTKARLVEAKAEDVSRAAIVDEYGELDRKIQEFKPTTKRYEELKKTIQGWYADLPAEQSSVAEGKLYTVQVGARENRRKITNMLKVYRLIGMQKFLELCSISLEAIEKVIAPSRLEGIISSERTGPRTLRPVAKASPAVAQAA